MTPAGCTAAVKLARDYIAACADFERQPLRYLAVHLQDDGVTYKAIQRPQATLEGAAYAIRGIARLKGDAGVMVIDLDSNESVSVSDLMNALDALNPIISLWSTSDSDFGDSVVVGNDLVTFPCFMNGGRTTSTGFIEPLPNARQQMSQFFTIYDSGQQRVGFDRPEIVTAAVMRHITSRIIGQPLAA